MSELNNLLDRLPRGSSLPLLPKNTAILNPFTAWFVRPPLVSEDPEPVPNAPIVIIGAPGAVGKSALAHFIAREKQCHVWDLSKLVLGANTFIGTLLKSFEMSEVPNLIRQLQRGETLFVLDAFDEAEIASGWQRVEIFLEEIYEVVKDAKQPCIVMTARSDTAYYMSIHLDDLNKKAGRQKKCYSSYRIDYFPEAQSMDFIQGFLRSKRKKEVPTLKDAIVTVFRKFYSVLGQDDLGSPWQNDKVRSFLGYAPVLQAISNFIAQHDNYMEVVQHFGDSRDGASLVIQIMISLLQREQEKVVRKIKESAGGSGGAWTDEDWSRLYTPIEQLKRLFAYHHRDIQKAWNNIDQYCEIDLPEWCKPHYRETLRSFLPQHPFLIEGKFAGPAFAEYAYAVLLGEDDFSDEVRRKLDSSSVGDTYILSPLFSEIFMVLREREIPASMCGYLYESVISRQTRKKDYWLDLFQISENELVFIITSSNEEEILNCKLVLQNNQPIIFPRQLANARIETNGEVILGSPNNRNDFELVNSSIVAEKIRFYTSSLVVRNYEPTHLALVESNHIEYPESFSIDCNNKDSFIVRSSPLPFPWSEYYKGDALRQSNEDEDRYASALRTILMFFRKGGVGFARHRKYIENVIVGRAPVRNAVLNYLVEVRLLTYNDFVYMLDWQRLNSIGINWEQLRRGIFNENFRELVRKIMRRAASS